MRLHWLDMPDSAAELAPWLERRLLHGDLAELTTELAALRPYDEAPAPSLDEALHGETDEVLRQGLTCLPPQALYTLVCHPELLLALQERVLSDGGKYWRQLPADERFQPLVVRGRQRLTNWLAATDKESQEERTRPSPKRPAVEPLRNSSPRRPKSGEGFWSQTLLCCLSSAACAVAAVFVLEWSRGKFPKTPADMPAAVAAAPWGWMDDAVFQSDVPAPVYLHKLAKAAEQWFAHRPEDPHGVALRIGEFRQGCSRLLLAEHPALSSSDREWLHERCRVWAQRLDEHLVALESGANPLQIREEADATVRRLIDALRRRADEIAQGTPSLG